MMDVVNRTVSAALGKKRFDTLFFAKRFEIREDCYSQELYESANGLVARYNCALQIYTECKQAKTGSCEFLDCLYEELVQSFNSVGGLHYTSSGIPNETTRNKRNALEHLLRSTISLLEKIDELDVRQVNTAGRVAA